jgi:hypothetical protein
MVAVPGAIPVTTPVCVTDATDGWSVDHVTGTPVTVAPFASRTVAVSVVVNATFTEALDGATVTLPISGAANVNRTVPTLPTHVELKDVITTPTAVMTKY